MANGLRDYVKYIVAGDQDAGVAYINPYISPTSGTGTKIMFNAVIPLYKKIGNENVDFSLIYSRVDRTLFTEYGSGLRNNYFMKISYSPNNNIVVLNPDCTTDIYYFVQDSNNEYINYITNTTIVKYNDRYEVNDKYGNIMKYYIKENNISYNYPSVIQMKNGDVINFTLNDNLITEIKNIKYGFKLQFYYENVNLPSSMIKKITKSINIFVRNKYYKTITFSYKIDTNVYYLSTINKYDYYVDEYDKSDPYEEYNYNFKYKQLNSGSSNRLYYYDMNNVTNKEYYRYVYNDDDIIKCIYHSKKPITLDYVTNQTLSGVDTILVEYGDYPIDFYIPKIIDLQTNNFVKYYHRHHYGESTNFLNVVSHVVRNDKYVSKMINYTNEIKSTNEFLLDKDEIENLVLNGYFESESSYWTTQGNVTFGTISNNSTIQHIDEILGQKMAKITNSSGSTSYLKQMIELEYFPTDEYVLGFWTCTNNASGENENNKVIIKYYLGDYLIETDEESFPFTSSFEFNIVSIHKEYTFNKIEVTFNIVDTLSIYIDGVFIKKGKYGIYGSKDNQNNVDSINYKNKSINVEYNDNNLPIKYTSPYKLFDKEITYNNLNQIVSETDGITTKTYTYDSNNNISSIATTNEDYSNTTLYEYDGYNNIIQVSDSENKKVYNTVISEYEDDIVQNEGKVINTVSSGNLTNSIGTYTTKSIYNNNKISNFSSNIINSDMIEFGLTDCIFLDTNENKDELIVCHSPSVDYLTLSTLYDSYNRTNEISLKLNTLDLAKETYQYSSNSNNISKIITPIKEVTNTYNTIKRDLIDTQTVSDNLTNLYSDVLYSFSYDDFDRIISVNLSNNHRYSYVYDSYNNLIEVKYYYLNSIYQTLYRYNNSVLTHSVYTSNGINIHQGYSDLLYIKNEDKTTNYFGYNYSVDTSNYLYTNEMQEKFDIYPLNYELCSLIGINPKSYIKHMHNGKYLPTFVYDDILMRSTYLANGSNLTFNLPRLYTCSFAFSFNVPSISNEKHYLFYINNYIYAYIQKNENNINNIILNYFYNEYNTNLNINVNDWQRLVVKIDRTIEPIDYIQRYRYTITISTGVKTFTTSSVREIEYLFSSLTIGCNYVLNYPETNTTDIYPLNGKIENLVISKVELSNITDTLLKKNNNILTNSILYDLANRKKYELISRDADIKAYNSYEYKPNSYKLTRQNFSCNNKTIGFDYEYDDFNNISKYKQDTRRKEYIYDDQNWLVKELYKSNNTSNTSQYVDGILKSTSYTYYSNGDLKTKTVENFVNSTNESYEYVHAYTNNVTLQENQIVINYNKGRVTSIGKYLSNNIVYDKTFEWHADKLMKCHLYENGVIDTTVEYTYNPLGLRNTKKIGNDITTYIYDDSNLVEEITSSYSVKYLYNSEGIYGFIKITPTTSSYYYYVKNIMGEIVGIINSNGNMIVSYEYDPYGNILSISGTHASTIGIENHILYKGYYYDVETGLFCLSSRYYSPELCRFISPDDIEYLAPESVNGLNLYCYCLNNPIMYADPSGHFTIAALLISFVASVAFEIIEDAMDGELFTDDSHNGWDYLGAGISGLFGGLSSVGGTLVKQIGSQVLFSLVGEFADAAISGDLKENGFWNTMGSIVLSTTVSIGFGVLSKWGVSKMKASSLRKLGSNNTANRVLGKMGVSGKIRKKSNTVLSKMIRNSNWIGNIIADYGASSVMGGVSSMVWGYHFDGRWF